VNGMRGVRVSASGAFTRRIRPQGLLVLVIAALVVSGCAFSCPPRKEVSANLPGRHPPDVIADSALARGGFEAFDPENCACTLEYRINLCVTINGAAESVDDFAGLSFVRMREGSAADTLSTSEVAGGARCFGEWRGLQRVLMLRESRAVDSSGWFEVQTVDCCHGEAKTVDFRQ
jgi:hypothetical protein